MERRDSKRVDLPSTSGSVDVFNTSTEAPVDVEGASSGALRCALGELCTSRCGGAIVAWF